MKKKVSFSIACYNEELNINSTYKALKKIAGLYKNKYQFEYVFSDNCSLDRSHELIKKWEEGYDVVVALRTRLEDSVFMNLTRKTFYKIFKKISNIEVPVNS